MFLYGDVTVVAIDVGGGAGGDGDVKISVYVGGCIGSILVVLVLLVEVTFMVLVVVLGASGGGVDGAGSGNLVPAVNYRIETEYKNKMYGKNSGLWFYTKSSSIGTESLLKTKRSRCNFEV